MGISRNSWHKRRHTGAKRCQVRKKRKFELGRPPANTKLGPTRIRSVRCMGGNVKYRGLRLETGNYSWGTEVCTRKTRILDVVYNASNNELVRTKTLVKGAVVVIDATPFRQWYESHYGITIGLKKSRNDKAAAVDKESVATGAKKTSTKKDSAVKADESKKTKAIPLKKEDSKETPVKKGESAVTKKTPVKKEAAKVTKETPASAKKVDPKASKEKPVKKDAKVSKDKPIKKGDVKVSKDKPVKKSDAKVSKDKPVKKEDAKAPKESSTKKTEPKAEPKTFVKKTKEEKETIVGRTAQKAKD
eukprot:CAMPEP_0171464174 /NCGR_PEP_ID=MMETSP0945-20130129/7576_1 /TAXON_ID=109269 /ORGANISM="Vaucheria litorea, Strain CCMP2940" /LENGTH=302 /DNA_ID=CAMNT_0011991165 /DNA_START=44 /DNA_END=952 /DNA_ORIENTATION=-